MTPNNRLYIRITFSIRAAIVLLGSLLFLHSRPTQAGGEKIWELAGHNELARGELIHTLLSNRGEIGRGLKEEKIDLEAVGMVWCAATDKNGTTYLGTGYDGLVYRIDGNKAHLIARTDNLVITDMLLTDDALYLSTIPSPTIWKIDHPNKIDPKSPVTAIAFAQLDKDELIWTLARDEKKGILYAGTGPEGKIWAIEKDGTTNLYLDTEEKHILDILSNADGTLYAGTSPNALLLKVAAPGSSFAIGDFDATEVKSIAPYKEESIVVGVNEFAYPRKAPTKKSVTTNTSSSTTPKNTSTTTSKLRSKDKGAVYVVAPDGSFEALVEETGTHVVMLAVDTDYKIWAAMGNDGRILSISKERIIHEVANLDEREVMWLEAADTLSFAATADTGAAYRFHDAKTTHEYLTPVLDAQNVSSFGRVTWSASGALQVRARSGNTVTPNDSWSAWSAPLSPNAIASIPAARYAQLKFIWKDKNAVLYSAELAYKPKNQRAIITAFDPDTPFVDTKGASKGEAGTSERAITARPDSSNMKQLALSWSVSNPDKDKLRYRLFYKPIDKSLWIPIFREDYRFTATHYTWPTGTIPEGRYHFKLVADDSIENPKADILIDEEISVPVNIDNHPPSISGLQYKNGRVSGTVTDSFSSIGAVDYSVDGGLWFPVASEDDLLDSPKETFRFSPFPALGPGGHVVTIRATDRNGNYTVQEIHMEIAQ